MTSDIGIPEALKKMDRLYERLETIRVDLGKFVSYEDECKQITESTSMLGQLHMTIHMLGDTVSSIRHKVNTLLEDESQ